MFTQEQNNILCRVEGDAPMGQLMRRHWLPACMSEEVAEPDCTPLKTRLLGETLVVFPRHGGQIGRVGRSLSPQESLPLVWPQRGMWPSMSLSRLEVRGRWNRSGHGV